MVGHWRLKTGLFVGVCFAAGWASLAAQGQAPLPPPPPPPVPGPVRGTSAIAVQVVADATGRPVKGASVLVILISDDATYTKNTLTDRDGRALLLGLTKGRARISASHQAYLAATFGQERPGDSGAFMPIGEAQTIGNITLRMKRGGALGGVVTNDAGEPMVGLEVQALRRGFTRGRQTFAPTAVDLTDDRGAYRISALQPGEYLIGVLPRYVDEAAPVEPGAPGDETAPADPDAVSPSVTLFEKGRIITLDASGPLPVPLAAEGVFLGYAPTFYPGTAVAEATAVKIGPAEQREGLDFRLAAVPVVHLSGSLAVPPDAVLTQARAVLVPLVASDRIVDAARHGSEVDAAGGFSLPFVPHGQYRIEVRANTAERPSAPSLWGAVNVTVDDQPQRRLTVLLRSGMRLSGQVRYASDYVESAVRALDGVQVQVVSTAPAMNLRFTLPADGRFGFRDLLPGPYTLSVSGLPYGWFASSAIVNGRDAFDFGLNIEPGQDLEGVVVTITDRMADLSGVLRNTAGTPATSGYVVVFPADRTYWTGSSRRVQAARPDSDGRFAFLRTLPPGDYLLVAADLEPGSWQDPTVLAGLEPRAARVQLRGNEKVVRDIRRQ